MNKRLLYLMLFCIVFAPRTSGQTPEVQKRPVPVAVTSNYYPQPKSLLLHLVNNSSKDITAYAITVKNKYADGTHDDDLLQQQYNMLNRLIEIQTAKDPAAQERRERELGDGIMFAGTTRTATLRSR
jgi:hypothetical protein